MNHHAILLLDDDARFRGFLARILTASGYEVIEAENVAQAEFSLSHYEISLAIVDFNLPDTNGISFVHRMRDAGNQTQVVFLSATQFDRQTFNHLRNILRVALILQKPIKPELFFQQIEGLLPAQQHKTTHNNLFAYSSPGTAEPPQQVSIYSAEYLRGNTADPHRDRHSRELQVKSAFDDSIRNAQADLADILPQQWQDLSIKLRKFQHDTYDIESRYDLFSLTRELHRDAASLGLTQVSEAAAKIEGYAKLLDPADPSGQEVLWLEMFRALSIGESALRSVTNSSSEAANQQPVDAGKVLLLGGAHTFQQPTAAVEQPKVDATFLFYNDIKEAATRIAHDSLDAAVIDVSSFGKKAAFALASEIRGTKQNGGIPLAFILPPNEQLTAAERIYYGCTATAQAPVGQRQLEDCLLTLATANQSSSARILAVDDDPVLTALIEKTLGACGMTVTSLNQAINILDALEQVQPDVLLLDVIMPGLSGYDICRMLRASEKWKDIPIIVLTSKSDAQGRAAAFQAGANDFLAKPILSEELLLRVRMQLNRADALDAEADVDKLTGLMSETAFMKRACEMFIDAGRSSDELTLCLMESNAFDEQREHGLFAAFNVLSAMGKLLKSHFSSSVLRGRRGDSGFALVVRKEDQRAVEAAMAMLLKEFSQLRFTSDNGQRFGATAKCGVASYPRHGMSMAALMEVAQAQLALSSAFPQTNPNYGADVSNGR